MRLSLAIAFVAVLGAHALAQQGGGRQGGAPPVAPAPPPTPRASAPIDLTGYWVSIVTEDWRYRMVTPAKGDHPSVPLNAAGNAQRVTQPLTITGSSAGQPASTATVSLTIR